jgi:hypothetical protein
LIRKLFACCVAALALLVTPTVAAHASAPAAARSVAAIAPLCGRDYYENVNGVCVHRPAKSPRGATARCRDGTYSYSRHARGTCSGHGGVARWIHHP